MNIENEILINKYGQGVLDLEYIQTYFKSLNLTEKRLYLNDLVYFIMQSKPTYDDIKYAIYNSNLKPTYTPCVILSKGIDTHILLKITTLPENELEKSLILFLNLFKIAYQRRFIDEKDHPGKWWYWDLTKDDNILKLKKQLNLD